MLRMNNLRTKRLFLTIVLLGAMAAGISAAPSPTVTEHPATLDVAIAPEALQPGDDLELILRIVPKSGIKINRYPKIRFNVAEQAGLLEGAEATLGNDGPPPPDKMDTNYFETVDPIKLKLSLDGSAKPGRHEIEADVKYFYCVAKSGFCAPKKERVKVSLDVR